MFNYAVFFILVFGAINWFCIGIFQFDIIAGIFGSQATFISRFLYSIIGLSGIWLLIYSLFKKGNMQLAPQKAPKPQKDKKEKKRTPNSAEKNKKAKKPDAIEEDSKITKTK